MISVAVALGVVVVVPAVRTMPVSTPFQYSFPVSLCSDSGQGQVYSVGLASGDLLAYRWQTSDGLPVDVFTGPSGPVVTTDGQISPTSAEFIDSSSGSSYVQGNGTPIYFSGCGYSLNGSIPSIAITGTVYSWLVS